MINKSYDMGISYGKGYGVSTVKANNTTLRDMENKNKIRCKMRA